MGCLVLNASYEPMKPLPTKSAIRLVLQGKAEVVAADPARLYRSERGEVEAPIVIRLMKQVKVPQKFIRKVTNTFLFSRDGHTCQYCGRHDSELRPREALNRDHVLPRSRGGKDVWTNCVTSCTTCNSRKDNRTPEEAGMRLLRKPTEPKIVYLRWHVRRLTDLQKKFITEFYGEDWLKSAV